MSGKRVLIVDDEAPLRFLLSKQLIRAGFETGMAADGASALAAAADGSFDAVVLDVVMPRMDGFEVCRRLKADPRTADAAVLFLSASCSGEFRRRAFAVGADDFLAKPFQTEQLPAYIQANLRRRENRPVAPGRLVAAVGTARPGGAATLATQLAEAAALQGPGPVMLIDLELPAGSIGARLQLSGGPNMGVILQNTGEPISDALIARVAQRYHSALEVMPAPFTPSAIVQGDPVPQRLTDVLDNLVGRGYHVVIHAGSRINELSLTALRRAETIWAVTADENREAYEALIGEMTAAGIHRETIRTGAGEPIGFSSRSAAGAVWRERQPVRRPETARLAVVA
ncbi:MAG: response regulator [Candidatus Promineofilum sp.]|nr:response regulator [Promineifilum sp.]